jgi:nitrite reductase/ring-hydroxylating ferredoxin subunit
MKICPLKLAAIVGLLNTGGGVWVINCGKIFTIPAREHWLGKYLCTFWQPLFRSKDIAAGEAVPIRIMSENFMLYRADSGTPHVVAARCAHRGTQLSLGWVEGDCLGCFYHGWKYDSSGQCVQQPGEEESFAKKIRMRTYPTEEYLGLIFAYIGEDMAPAYPDTRFEEEGIVISVPRQDWPCNYFNRLDNPGDQSMCRMSIANDGDIWASRRRSPQELVPRRSGLKNRNQ